MGWLCCFYIVLRHDGEEGAFRVYAADAEAAMRTAKIHMVGGMLS